MNLSTRHYLTASRLIARAAAKYARRTGSEGMEDDLAAAAWVALLETCERWTPERGSWEGYVLTVTARAIRRELWTLRAPVSGSPWRASTWAAGLSSAGTECLHAASDACTTATPPPAPDAFAIGAEFIDAVREALMDTPGAELALAVLLQDQPIDAVAAEHATTPARVRLAIHDARTTVQQTLGHFARGRHTEEDSDP